MVRTLNGGKIMDINGFLSAQKENCFESVFLLVGTNDAAIPGSTTDSITKVVIICLPPRLDSVQATRNLGMINDALKQISQILTFAV